MNRCYVTAWSGRIYTQLDEILSDWHDGKEFRIYQYAQPCTLNDVVRLRMAGFTHVCFVWQDSDLRIRHHDLELK
jgi:hypothetical protein